MGGSLNLVRIRARALAPAKAGTKKCHLAVAPNFNSDFLAIPASRRRPGTPSPHGWRLHQDLKRLVLRVLELHLRSSVHNWRILPSALSPLGCRPLSDRRRSRSRRVETCKGLGTRQAEPLIAISHRFNRTSSEIICVFSSIYWHLKPGLTAQPVGVPSFAAIRSALAASCHGFLLFLPQLLHLR
jgi:hypothetical protein